MKLGGVTVAALLMAGTFLGCGQAPKHRYSVPEGTGRILYSPERGIYREGEPVNETLEGMFRRGMEEFDRRDYGAANSTFRTIRLSPEWVDGPRALDAGMMEAIAKLEGGRQVRTAWLLGDMAGAWFEPDESYWRARLPRDYWQISSEDVVAGYATTTVESAIRSSFEVTKDLFDYYSAGLGVARERLLDLSRHARNLAWIALVGGRDKLAAEIAGELVKRNPRGTIEAQALLMLALAQTRLGNHASAQVHFSRIYLLSDEPALRERALLGEVEAIIRESKGEEYDVKFYELASEKINEYKTDFLVQHTEARFAREFAALEQYVNDVQWRALKKAAADYRRLFEPNSAELAEQRAAEFRAAADRREVMLRRIVGQQETR